MLIDSKVEVTVQHLLQLHEERAKCCIHSAIHTNPDDIYLGEIFSEYARQSQTHARELKRYQHDEAYEHHNATFSLRKIRQELMKTFIAGHRSMEQTLRTCLVMEEAMQNAYATALLNEKSRQRALGFKEVLRMQQAQLRNSYNRIVSLQQQVKNMFVERHL